MTTRYLILTTIISLDVMSQPEMQVLLIVLVSEVALLTDTFTFIDIVTHAIKCCVSFFLAFTILDARRDRVELLRLPFRRVAAILLQTPAESDNYNYDDYDNS